ncbi:MAG: pseudoazurin [Pseudomonadota bacterium]
MTLSNRRNFMVGVATVALIGSVKAQGATTHDVKMLNAHPDDPRKRMVFYPRVLQIKPGDSVRFIPTDPAHNSQTTKGMVPEGAEGWKSGFNKEVTITLNQAGVYGYNCQPHQAAGMVGLVIVEGENKLANLEAAKGVRQIGLAKKVWEEIWAEAEDKGYLSA